MTIEQIDKAATTIAETHKKEIAIYLGKYKGKRTYVLGFRKSPNSYGGNPLIIQHEGNGEFSFVGADDILNVVVYFGERQQKLFLIK